jgi:hypothetical protein
LRNLRLRCGALKLPGSAHIEQIRLLPSGTLLRYPSGQIGNAYFGNHLKRYFPSGEENKDSKEKDPAHPVGQHAGQALRCMIFANLEKPACQQCNKRFTVRD